MAEPTQPSLVRAIGRRDLVAAVVNGVIGSSIFGLPGTLAVLTGALSPLAALGAGVFTLLVVLCFAEVASRFDQAGGPYLYAREAFGPTIGFQAGWLTYWIRVTALAANLSVFAQYLARLVPAAGSTPGRAVTITALVLALVAINVVGVRQATWTINAFTLAKLLPLVLLVVLGLPALSSATLATQAVAQPDWGQAIVLLVFAYGGFESPLIPAGEARDPRRDSGFALLVALGLVAMLYLLVQLVVVGVVPHVADHRSAPLAAAFEALIGPAGATLVALTVLVSIYGYATGNVLQAPRLLLAMAERGELPSVLGRVHQRFRTPHVAVIVTAACPWALALYGGFEWNATLSAVVRLATYALTCGALLVFRRRAGAPLGFQVPGGRVVAWLGVAACTGLLVTRSFAQAGVLLALGLAGVLVREWTRRRGR